MEEIVHFLESATVDEVTVLIDKLAERAELSKLEQILIHKRKGMRVVSSFTNTADQT